jgi:hypothetical protein
MFKLICHAAKNYASIKLLDGGSDALLFRYVPYFQRDLPPNTKRVMSELIRRQYLDVTDRALTFEEAAACKLIVLYQMHAAVGREQHIEAAMDRFESDFSNKLSPKYAMALNARRIF